MRRRQFEHTPSVERYHQVLKAGAAAGRDDAVLRGDLFTALEVHEIEDTSRGALTGSFATRRREQTPSGRDVTLRAEVLCSEGRWAEACELVQPPAVCRDSVLQHIAMHLDDTHREQALELLLRVFRIAMRRSSSPYREELVLVGEIARRLDAQRRSAWLSQLRAEYKAKRNFVRDLPQG